MKKAKYPQDRRFGYEPDEHLAEQQMKDIVYALNRFRIRTSASKRGVRLELEDYQLELREYVSRWKASGPNLFKLFAQDPELAKKGKTGATTFWPSNTGRGYLEWSSDFSDEDASPEGRALHYFFQLIANPKWRMLAGPCKRCNDYFLAETVRERTYCSRTCSGAETAIAAMKKKRDAERKERIALAKKAIRKWKETKTRLDWKKWVAYEIGSSQKWLSHAVNRRDLKEPIKKRAKFR